MKSETKPPVLKHPITPSDQWMTQPNNLDEIFKDMISGIKEITKLSSNLADDLDQIRELLFRVSWRSCEIPWSIRDAEATKTIAPWKYLDFLANFMIQKEPQDIDSFIKKFVISDDFKNLESQIKKAKELYNNKQHKNSKDAVTTTWPVLASHIDKFIDDFYISHIKENLQIVTNEIKGNNSDIARTALLEILSIIGESAKKINQDKHQNIPFKALIDIRDAIEHPRNQQVRQRLKEIREDQEGTIFNGLVNELEALSNVINDGSQSGSFPLLNHIASNSILSFKELEDLTKDCACRPKEQQDYFLSVFNGNPKVKFPSKDNFSKKIDTYGLKGKPLATKLGGLHTQMQERGKKKKKEATHINFRGLTMDSKIVRAIDDVGSRIEEFLKVFQNIGAVSDEVLQLAVKHKFKSVAMAAARLIDGEFASLNNKESVLPDNLIQLGKLRNLIAHRPFELNRKHFKEVVEQIAAFMKVDLEEVKNKIKNSPESNAPEPKLENQEIDLYEHLHNNSEEIYKLQTRFGIRNNVSIIGKHSQKPCDIGIQIDLELLIEQEDTSTFLDQMRFETKLSRLLKLKVTTSTETQLQDKFKLKSTPDHLAKVLESKTELSEIYRSLEVKRKFKPRKYFYNKDDGETVYAKNPEEVLIDPSRFLINESSHANNLEDDSRNANEAEMLSNVLLVQEIIKGRAKIISENFKQLFENDYIKNLSIGDLKSLVQNLYTIEDLNEKYREKIKVRFCELYEEVHFGALVTRWVKKEINKQNRNLWGRRSFGSLEEGVEHYFQDNLESLNFSAEKFGIMKTESEKIRKTFQSISQNTPPEVLHELRLLIHTTWPDQSDYAVILSSKDENQLLEALYKSLMEKFRTPGAISPFVLRIGAAEIGGSTFFKEVKEEYNKRKESDFISLVYEKKMRGEYVTPIVNTLYESQRWHEARTNLIKAGEILPEQLLHQGASMLQGLAHDLIASQDNTENLKRRKHLTSEKAELESYLKMNEDCKNEHGVQSCKRKLEINKEQTVSVSKKIENYKCSPKLETRFYDFVYEDRLQFFKNFQDRIEYHSTRLENNADGCVDVFSKIAEEQPEAVRALLQPQVDKFKAGKYDQWDENFTQWLHNIIEAIYVQERRSEFIKGLTEIEATNNKRKASSQSMDDLQNSVASSNHSSSAASNPLTTTSLSTATTATMPAQVNSEVVAVSSHTQAIKRTRINPAVQNSR